MKTIAMLIPLMLALQSCSLESKEDAYVMKPPAMGGVDDLHEYKAYTEQDAVKHWPQTGAQQDRARSQSVSLGAIMIVGLSCEWLDMLFGYEEEELEPSWSRWSACENVHYWQVD